MRHRSGMSLLEITITVAIFATLMAMAVQASQGANQAISEDSARDDLSAAGQRALAQIANDITATAWFYDWVDTDGDGEPGAGETINFRMPWVNPPWRVGAASVGDGIANYPDGTAAVAPPEGAPNGDRLLFTRLQTGFATLPVPPRFNDIFPFDDPAQAPVRMSRFMNGAPVPELMLNESAPAGADTNFLTQRWDSDQSNTWSQNRDKSRLRLYAYVLRPSTRTSMGCLVRVHRNATAWSLPLPAATFAEDTELCDWVESVRFDTWRTQPQLEPNQLRVHLVLRRDATDASRTMVRRHFEATFAMRSITYED